MKKRLFTSALAAVMTFSSIAAMSANAIAHIPVRSDSEEYQKKIKNRLKQAEMNMNMNQMIKLDNLE